MIPAAKKKPGRRYSRELQQEDRSVGQVKERFAELGWPCDPIGRDLGEDLNVRIPIPEIVKELDVKRAGWRDRKTVAVSIALANGTDDEGFKRLRCVVADHNLPIVPKSEPMIFSLNFASTSEGLEAVRRLETALDQGQSVTSEHGFVPTIEYPEWHRRIYGPCGRGQPIKVTVGPPTPTPRAKVVRVEIESSEGPAACADVEFRATTQGRKRLVLTNEHQDAAIEFCLQTEGDPPVAKFGFRRARVGNTVYEERETAAFLLAATTAGSNIRVVDSRSGELWFSLDSARVSPNFDPAGMRRWRDVLDKLCFIQQRATPFGAITREALQTITAADVEDINGLFEILRDGRVEIPTTVRIKMEAGGEPLPDGSGLVHLDRKADKAVLLGLEIHLGDVRAEVVDSDRFMNARGGCLRSRLSHHGLQGHLYDTRRSKRKHGNVLA